MGPHTDYTEETARNGGSSDHAENNDAEKASCISSSITLQEGLNCRGGHDGPGGKRYNGIEKVTEW
jgi:hypothetical protein